MHVIKPTRPIHAGEHGETDGEGLVAAQHTGAAAALNHAHLHAFRTLLGDVAVRKRLVFILAVAATSVGGVVKV